MENFICVAEQFSPGGEILDIWEFGHGNSNDRFIVTREGVLENWFVLHKTKKTAEIETLRVESGK